MHEEDQRSQHWEQVAARTHFRHKRAREQAMLRRHAARSTPEETKTRHCPRPPSACNKTLQKQREGEARDELQRRKAEARQQALEQDKVRRRAAGILKSALDRQATAEEEFQASIRAAERKRGADEVAAQREFLRLGASKTLSEAKEQGRRLGEACEQRRSRQHAILQQAMLQQAEGGRFDSEATLIGRELARMAQEDIDVAWKDPAHWTMNAPTHVPWRQERRIYTRGPRGMPGVDLSAVKLNNK